MKTTIIVFITGIVSMAKLQAQSLQEGINHLYAERDKSAKAVFEKMVAANPNNLEAVYWLGQADIALNNVAAARDIYSKTLQANGNAPLILAGMGHVELLEGKKDEARQHFETAISLSTGKKGVDANVLNAVGRANIDAKEGDALYAIDKLKLAAERDPKNADIFLNLGDAYRKIHEGGQAVVNYDKAVQANPSIARAIYRKGMIYYTQRNWELFEQLMKQATTVDPNFAPAYYQLYYYYLGKLDLNTAQEYANKFISTTEQDPQNDFLRIQTLWAQKKYQDAIAAAKNLINTVGDQQVNVRTYRLLADASLAIGDTASAKMYLDKFFAKAKEDEINLNDILMKAAAGGTDQEVFDTYVKAAQMDSVYSTKMETLQKAVDYFEKKKKWCPAAEMRIAQAKARKNPLATDPFFIGLRFYQCGNYKRADSALLVYTTLTPDTVFGHYYRAKVNFALDTTMSVEPYVSTMVNEYQKTLDLAKNDMVKFKNQAVEASKVLAGYYNNMRKNKDSALLYLQKGLAFDTGNTNLKELIDYLQKTATKPTKPSTPVKQPPKKNGTSAVVKPKTKTKPVAKQ